MDLAQVRCTILQARVNIKVQYFTDIIKVFYSGYNLDEFCDCSPEENKFSHVFTHMILLNDGVWQYKNVDFTKQ